MKENNNFDVIVVGAGVIGCSIAHSLTASGYKTALIEKAHIGAGASGANFGMVQSNDVELEKSIPMLKASYAKYKNLEDELESSVGLRQISTLRLLSSEKQWKLSEERSNILPKHGIEYEFIPPERINEIEPLVDPRGLFGATYSPTQAQLNPFLLMWAYLRKALKTGLNLFTYTEVTGFKIKGGRIFGVQTNQGDFNARAVILATAAWTRSLGSMIGQDWRIHTFRASAMATQPVDNINLNTILISADHIEMEVTSKEDVELTVLALTQTPSKHFLIAQADRPGEVLDPAISHAAPKTMAIMAGRYLPALRNKNVVRSWTAPTTFTDDGRPLLGPVDGIDGLILAASYRSAIIHAPLAGEIITQLVTSKKTDLIDISPFAPERKMKPVDAFYTVKSSNAEEDKNQRI